MNSVLLTIDLTKAVADEAIERKDCVVVAYRVQKNPDHEKGHHLTPFRSYNISRSQKLDTGRLPTTIAPTVSP